MAFLKLRVAKIFQQGLVLSSVCLLLNYWVPQSVQAEDAVRTAPPYQVFMPLINQQARSLVDQIAASLPSASECKNCFTREAFLAMPPEELAAVEASELNIQASIAEMNRRDELVHKFLASGQFDPAHWPTLEQAAQMTPAELQQVTAAQNADLAQYATSVAAAGGLATSGNSSVSIAYLPADNIQDNTNSCGPASIRVALSVRKAVNQIDTIDNIGKTVDKNPNGSQGNWKDGLEAEDIARIGSYMNGKLNFGANTPYYKASSSGWAADPSAEFRKKAESSLKANLAMIFGVLPGQLPDWHFNKPHIVTAYGVSYDAQGRSMIAYADTAPILSGHYKGMNGKAAPGAYYNTLYTSDLWNNAARYNDFQVYQ